MTTLVSIYTPTHDLTYIKEAYESLKIQTYKKWEWVIQPNGPVNKNDFPADMLADDRVKFCSRVLGCNIGALKALAVEQCGGELLLELDHDDYLVPGALARIVKQYEKAGKGKAFIYSDCVHFFPDHKSEVFPERSGWTHYNFHHNDRDDVVMNSFEATPRALCEIYWSPNHVRVWSREAYNAAGGYDMGLKVGDDHDLMVRTYLAGVDFYYINEPLYFYRRYDGNSFVIHNQAVQQQQFANRDKYIYKLWAEWCRREGLLMIDLGGAYNCPKEDGYFALDVQHLEGVDYVCDVTKGLPFDDEQLGLVRAVDFLEHIPIGKVVPLMNRLYRKLAPGGLLATMTPSVRGPDGTVGCGAYQDPTHVSFWSENNFWYFTRAEQAKFVPQIKCRFQATRLFTDWPSEWHRKNYVAYVHADLLKIGGSGRVPGGVAI